MCHSEGKYVDGEVSNNSIEPFWAYLKRTYKAPYHWWSFKHRHRYVDEIAGRFNLRRSPVLDRMRAVVLGMEGRTLKYRVLVGGQ